MEFGLSLGSNLGDRVLWLQQARDALARLPGVRLAAQAPLYETEPVGVKPEFQHLKYLNTVVVLESDLAPAELHRHCAEIEDALGRVRNEDKFAPRTIDIDLLYAGDQTLNRAGLIIPHPRWTERLFVLRPLADIRPDLVVPGASRTARELAEAVHNPGVKMLLRSW